MDIDNYNHAIKILKEKKKDFKNEVEIVNNEILTLKNTYIRENAKFKIYEEVRYTIDNKVYSILNININNKGNFIYNLSKYRKEGYFEIMYIDIDENKLIKKK